MSVPFVAPPAGIAVNLVWFVWGIHRKHFLATQIAGVGIEVLEIGGGKSSNKATLGAPGRCGHVDFCIVRKILGFYSEAVFAVLTRSFLIHGIILTRLIVKGKY